MKAKWEQDLCQPNPNPQWVFCCKQIKEISNCRFRQIQLKLIQRACYTPYSLKRYGLLDHSKCTQRWPTPYDVDCPPIDNYWTPIWETIREITGVDLLISPLVIIWGSIRDITKAYQKLIALAGLLSKWQIIIRWCTKPNLTHATWLKDKSTCNTHSET